MKKRLSFKKLENLLLEKNISKNKLAKKIGVASSVVSSWTTNRHEPVTSMSVKICNVLECQLQDICEPVEIESE